MGAYQNIYIGPYMVVKHLVEDGTVSYKVCGNESCERKKKVETKFCPQCGQAPVSKTDPVKVTVEAQQVLSDKFEDYHNDIYFPHAGGTDMFKDKCLLIPNGSEGRPIKIDIDENSSNAYPLSDLSKIPEDIAWFENENKKYFDYLRQEFGEANCKMEWGIVVHYN